MATPAIMRVRIVGSIHGQETNNVLHFKYVGIDLVDQVSLENALLLLAQNVLACVVDTLLPAVTADWRIRRVEANQIAPTLSDPVEALPEGDVFGELATSNVSFAASLVNIRTGTGGRKGRGKIFLPPPGDAQMTASDIDGPTVALLAAFLACLAGKFMGTTPTTAFRLGVLSRLEAGANNANALNAWREAVTLTPNARVAIMSSRKVGVGS